MSGRDHSPCKAEGDNSVSTKPVEQQVLLPVRVVKRTVRETFALYKKKLGKVHSWQHPTIAIEMPQVKICEHKESCVTLFLPGLSEGGSSAKASNPGLSEESSSVKAS